MDLDDRAVQRHRLDLDPDDLLLLECRKDPIQHTCLGPAVHPRIDRMPVAKAFRHTTPLAAVLRDIQDRVQYLKIRYAYIAPLTRQAALDTTILCFCDFHIQSLSQNRPLVLTGPR